MEKEPLVNFGKELQHTENYLSIQQIRFGEKLHVALDIDPAARDTLLPPYALQTLVENAFKHGLEKKTGEKELTISLRREGNWVSLIVTDNGPELQRDDTGFPAGVGLANLRKRLEITFDQRTRLSMERIGEEN
jgi:sensor histidine kinase YesM